MNASRRLRVAVVGPGRLGRACVQAVTEHPDLELAGVVGRPGGSPDDARRAPRLPLAGHVRDLEGVDVALLCVPAIDAEAVATELLQQRLPVVECAGVAPEHLAAYHARLDDFARRHRATVVFAAGWDPGVLTLVRGAFDVLIPRGETLCSRRPAASLHHTAAAEQVAGVRGARALEFSGADGRPQRYVYVELERGASEERVAAAIAADPAFAGEPTQVFPVDSLEALEEEAHGALLERRGTAASGAHQSLLLEARGDAAVLAARAMADAASRIAEYRHGGQRYVP
jgi:diaminopimelate dehydrogenase